MLSALVGGLFGLIPFLISIASGRRRQLSVIETEIKVANDLPPESEHRKSLEAATRRRVLAYIDREFNPESFLGRSASWQRWAFGLLGGAFVSILTALLTLSTIERGTITHLQIYVIFGFIAVSIVLLLVASGTMLRSRHLRQMSWRRVLESVAPRYETKD